MLEEHPLGSFCWHVQNLYSTSNVRPIVFIILKTTDDIEILTESYAAMVISMAAQLGKVLCRLHIFDVDAFSTCTGVPLEYTACQNDHLVLVVRHSKPYPVPTVAVSMLLHREGCLRWVMYNVGELEDGKHFLSDKD